MHRSVSAVASAAAAALALSLGAAPSAAADAFPSKPVKVIVPFSPGGALDTLIRAVGQGIGETSGQPFVVDSRPGAGGMIGMDAAKRMPPDGYGMVIVSNSQAAAQAIYPHPTYDLQKDFMPVVMLADSPVILAANAESGIRSLRDLIERARAQPGKLSYGSCGVGTVQHLAMEIIKSRTKVDIAHIAYKSCTAAAIDAVAGRIEIVVGSAPPVLPYVRQGKLVPLAVANGNRAQALPDTPTLAQSGVPELASTVVSNWNGLMVPAGTPPGTVSAIAQLALGQLDRPEVKEQLKGVGLEAQPGGRDVLASQIAAGLQQFSEVVKTAGIKPE